MKSKSTLNVPYCLGKNDGYYIFLKDSEMWFLTQMLQEFAIRGNLRMAHETEDERRSVKLRYEEPKTYQLGNELMLKFWGAVSRHNKTILVDGCDIPNPMYGKNRKYRKSK